MPLLSLGHVTVINLLCCLMNPGEDFVPVSTLELYSTLNQALTIPNPNNGDLEWFVFVQRKRGQS